MRLRFNHWKGPTYTNFERQASVKSPQFFRLPGIGAQAGPWFALVFATVSAAMLGACNEAGKDPSGPVAVDTSKFSVNETFAADLVSKGVPEVISRFLAASRMDSHCPNDTTCIYLQSFLNGAAREMTLKVSPNRAYAPKADELVSGGIPLYAFNYASDTKADGTMQIDMDYYVLKAGLPKGSVPKASAIANAAEDGGAGIEWTEIGKKGSEAGIGSLIDYFKDKGHNVGEIGNIFTLASAMSNVATSGDQSIQDKKWLAELDALEECAANPTNPVAKSDPNYSQTTVAKIQAARSELKTVSAVRYLNNMTETGADANPVTAIMSVGLKQGFV